VLALIILFVRRNVPESPRWSIIALDWVSFYNQDVKPPPPPSRARQPVIESLASVRCCVRFAYHGRMSLSLTSRVDE
jgi:hypothetical protein